MGWSAWAVWAQNYNLELLSQVRFNETAANIWGYANAKGQEFAIIGLFSGTSIFEVTDPNKPVLLKHIPGAPGVWREIKSYQDRLYVVADQGNDGVLIINMSDPSNIQSVFWKAIVQYEDRSLSFNKAGPIDRSHSLYIDEKGFAYLTGSSFHNGVVILDLTKNPDQPELVSVFNPNYTHDGFARGDTFWAADIFMGEFSVWNVKDKKKPVKLASQRTGNFFTHNIWLSDDGQTAFTTDERANAFIESYDVSNLSNIKYLDQYRSRTTRLRGTIPHNTHYHKSFLVNSYYTDGLTLVDASIPDHLVEVGAYDTYPAGDGGFHGVWGVYPYLPSGIILASDIEFGLFIFKPTYQKAQRIAGLVTDSITGNGIAGVTIQLLAPIPIEVSSSGNGRYKTGSPYSGMVKMRIYKAEYETKELLVNLQPGARQIIHVQLKPRLRVPIAVRVVDKENRLIPAARVYFENELERENLPAGFFITTLHSGAWQVIAGSWGYTSTSKMVQVQNPGDTILMVLDRGYQDEFLFDFGWTAASTASSGIWGRAIPRPSFHFEFLFNPEKDLDTDLGRECMITGNGGNEATANDVDNGYTRLFSPELDLTNYANPILRFFGWTIKQNLNLTKTPVGHHKVYLLSGPDTVAMHVLAPGGASWQPYEFVINRRELKNPHQVKFIFEAWEPAGADLSNIIEFGVDGFQVTDGVLTSAQNPGSNQADLNLYPNPWQDHFTLEFPPQTLQRSVEIIDLYGRLCYQVTIPDRIEKISLQPDLAPGIYYIKLQSEHRTIRVRKMVKL
jgi:choice-of-anchor B domain-containing protein